MWHNGKEKDQILKKKTWNSYSIWTKRKPKEQKMSQKNTCLLMISNSKRRKQNSLRTQNSTTKTNTLKVKRSKQTSFSNFCLNKRYFKPKKESTLFLWWVSEKSKQRMFKKKVKTTQIREEGKLTKNNRKRNKMIWL